MFKVEENEKGEKKLNTRLVVLGNRVDEKYEVRKDAIDADMMITRMVLALGMMIRIKLGVSDIKGAYMKREGPNDGIYLSSLPLRTIKVNGSTGSCSAARTHVLRMRRRKTVAQDF